MHAGKPRAIDNRMSVWTRETSMVPPLVVCPNCAGPESIGLTRIGEKVDLKIDRGGSEHSVDVRVELAEQTAGQKTGPER